MNKKSELEAARNLEPDCPYGAVGAGRYTWRARVYEAIRAALVAETEHRKGRSVEAWILAERECVMREVNRQRALLAYDPVALEIVERAERLAVGHSDYISKYAHAAADLVLTLDQQELEMLLFLVRERHAYVLKYTQAPEVERDKLTRLVDKLVCLTAEEQRRCERERERVASLAEHELHREQRHPDYEYATTENARKSCEAPKPHGDDTWEANNIIPNHAYEMGVVIAEYWRNWERDDFTETNYWRRRKPAEGPLLENPALGVQPPVSATLRP
jgi:hypothetical protein